MKGQKSKNKGAGAVGFSAKENLRDMIEVIDDTKIDTRIWIGVRRERGTKHFLMGNIYRPPVSYSTVYAEERRGEVKLRGDVNARITRASQLQIRKGQRRSSSLRITREDVERKSKKARFTTD